MNHQTNTNPKFLVFDDESMTAQTIVNMASSCGYDADYVTEPDEFFTRVNKWFPDVIALDLMMPKMDGVEVIESLAKSNCHSKIIITSGLQSQVLNTASDSAKAHGLDILGTLAKPFTLERFNNLLDTLETSVESRSVDTAKIPTIDPYAITRSDFISAIQSGQQIYVQYQPKIICKTGTIAGFEALARWSHPELGFIPPDVFIVLAEEYEIIDELTKVIAKQALDWLAAVSSLEYAQAINSYAFQRIALSLNVSAKSLDNRELFDWIYNYCVEKGIQPSRITLELTESSTMANMTSSLSNLTRLRMRGFHLSIDDFGTGYSSMKQLVRLPFSEIKIDKSFVMQALQFNESKAIVKSIVELGRSLNMDTTAEGIEDIQTLAFLRDLGCSLAQGYFISAPLSDQKIQDWFVAWERLREHERQTAIENSGLLDSLQEERFDRITQLAKNLFNTPISIVSFLDQERQWFKSKQGIALTEVPRCVSFCTAAIEFDDEFIITDTHADKRFRDNPFVSGAPGIRFYAGQPICLKNGIKIGTLCIIDTTPHDDFTEQDRKILKELAYLVEEEMNQEEVEYRIEYHSGLLCRETFKNRAESYLTFCQKAELPLTICSMHLAGLSQVNAVFGIEEGDRVLRECAEILSSLARNHELVGRYRNTRIALQLINLEPDQAKELQSELNAKLSDWSGKNPEITSLLNLRFGFSHQMPTEGMHLENVIEQSLSAT